MSTRERVLLAPPQGTAASVTATEEGRAFFQQRLTVFGFCVFLLSGGSWVVGAAIAMFGRAGDRPEIWSAPSLFQLGATAIAGLLWVLLQPMRLSGPMLHASDVVATLGMSLLFAGSGAYASRVPDGTTDLVLAMFVMTLAVNFTLITRAIIVPSTGLRTLALGVPCCVVVVALTAWCGAQAEHQPFSTAAAAISAATWCGIAVAIQHVASKIIFGLRREVTQIRVLGQYALEEKIGEGGMGEVWRASHAMLRRPTAVKLLPPGRAGEAAVRRFEREVQLTARLQHPNTVAIFDYGRTPDGVFYYAMELLDGTDLEALVAQHGPLPAGRVVHVLRQVCGALSEAHGLGLVHRDIKPANILLTTRAGEPDVAKVVDFGLVKDLETTGAAGGAGLSSVDVITGTPLYLSPEAIVTPESVEARSDIYALGAVGFFLLTGRTPFEGRSIVEVCGHHMHTPPPRPSAILGGPVPADLEEVIAACLAKAPSDRPADALTLRRRLDACAAATEWSAVEAGIWWSTHASPARPRRTSLTGPRTIAVALDERVPAA